MLFTPTLAVAQDTPAPQPQPEASDEAADESFAEDTGEIVVLGRFIPEPMRETSEVATFLSSEDLARQGDDNAALALTRLTGLSVVSNRFVYVRGLGDRYSSALLNGSPLPSPEPLRRQVPLDLFPSNILDGATVQKTFSPNYPGEFGGGIIDLRTLRIPLDPFLTIKAGTGYNTEATNQRGLVYYGERSDWTTVSDGLRELPDAVEDAIARDVRISRDTGFTEAELEEIGESFANSPLTVVQSEELDPDFEGEINAGTSFDVGRYNVGLLGVFGYDSAWRTRDARRIGVVGNVDNTEFQTLTSTWDIVGNLFGSASVGWDENELALTGLLVRSSTKYAQVSEGRNNDFAGGDLRRESTAWYERQLGSVQLAGEHRFGALDVEWRGAFAESTREAPYERSIVYVLPDGGVPSYAPGNGGNETRFSYLTDQVLSGGVDLDYTIALSEERDAIISAGWASSRTERDYEFYSFSFSTAAGTPQSVLELRPDFLFSPDNIDPLRFEINENFNPNANYVGELDVDAGYVSADVEVIPLVRAAIGVRYEDAVQSVSTGVRYPLPPGFTPAAPALIENTYWLPAATLTWNFAEDLQLRLGYSQTIARPQFRELAFTPFIDPDTDRIYQGNPYLQDSEFVNYDARVEYYFGRDRFVTGGLFYKTIDSPIEEVVISPNGTDILTRFLNAPQATLWGVEADFRTRFEMPFELPGFFSTAEWFFGANYTYTNSEVTAGEDDIVINVSVDPAPAGQPAPTAPARNFITDGSQLQGTPEHIANLQFGFDTEATQLTLLVGYVSERISRRGDPTGANVPTVFEDPGILVDLVFRHNFTVSGTDLSLGLSARNLLAEPYTEYQNSDLGQTDFNSYERGTSFSASLTARF
ncbi:MAG: TonB-dependent receptor [Hyphomonadaceae bacterium]|nr:TonB-dependent receptor [Hyphomonadaceae bacterium]